jgi:hypothetical protein
MRNLLIAAVAAAFALGSFGAAGAYPSTSTMKHDAEIKDAAKSNAAMAKDMAKDAKKHSHKAKHKAKVASNKADDAAKKAEKAEKAVSPG